MVKHSDYHYSTTIKTDSLAVVSCLRALAARSQMTGNQFLAWKGTTDEAWREAGGLVTFRFTSPVYRSDFFAYVAKLLPVLSCRIISVQDDSSQLLGDVERASSEALFVLMTYSVF